MAVHASLLKGRRVRFSARPISTPPQTFVPRTRCHVLSAIADHFSFLPGSRSRRLLTSTSSASCRVSRSELWHCHGRASCTRNVVDGKMHEQGCSSAVPEQAALRLPHWHRPKIALAEANSAPAPQNQVFKLQMGAAEKPPVLPTAGSTSRLE